MKFLRTLHTDLRERQILPAVVLLAVLAVAIPIGAPMVLGKVSAPPPVARQRAACRAAQGRGAAEQGARVADDGRPVTSLTRRGAEPNPFREAGGSAGGSTSAASTPSKARYDDQVDADEHVHAREDDAREAPRPRRPRPQDHAREDDAGEDQAQADRRRRAAPQASSGVTPAVPVTPTTGPATLKSTQAYTVNIDTKDAKALHVLTRRRAPGAAARRAVARGRSSSACSQGGKKAAFLFTNAVKVSGRRQRADLPARARRLPDRRALARPGHEAGADLEHRADRDLHLRADVDRREELLLGRLPPSRHATRSRRPARRCCRCRTRPSSQTLRFDDKIGALVHQNVPASPPSGSGGSTGSTGATGATGSSGSTGATGGTSANAERFPNGVAFVLSPAALN